MKYAIIIALLLLASCKKDNPTTSEILGFRSPTCNDAADDGIHEAYNGKEAASFLSTFTDSPTQDATAITGISITGNTIAQSGAAHLKFTAGKAVQLNLWLPITGTAMQAYEGTFAPGPGDVDLSALYLGGFPSNCTRMYFVFSQPITGSQNQVVSKGHFDVSIL